MRSRRESCPRAPSSMLRDGPSHHAGCICGVQARDPQGSGELAHIKADPKQGGAMFHRLHSFHFEPCIYTSPSSLPSFVRLRPPFLHSSGCLPLPRPPFRRLPPPSLHSSALPPSVHLHSVPPTSLSIFACHSLQYLVLHFPPHSFPPLLIPPYI